MDTAPAQLVADVGGTHARFALVTPGNRAPQHVLKLATADYPDIASATRAYLNTSALAMPPRMCIAVAGPVESGEIRLTNNRWTFSRTQLQHELGLDSVKVINDFEAMAWAVSVADTSALVQIGGQQTGDNTPIAVIGPGTGFGAALLLPNSDGEHRVIATEGGHASLAPADSRELAVIGWLLKHNIFPCRESLLCGGGLARIYRALGDIDSNCGEDLPAHLIQQRAVSGNDQRAIESLELFCALLGTAAADQALCSGAVGGVYITGGIVRRFVPFLQQSRFRERFDGERPMHHYLRKIPIYIVTAAHQGLVGAARARYQIAGSGNS